MGELWRWPATDLAAAIRDGAISSREAVTDCLARIHSVNPTLNALVEVHEAQALAAADSTLTGRDPAAPPGTVIRCGHRAVRA